MSSQDKIETPFFTTLNEAYGWLDSHINYEKQLDRISDRDNAFKLDPIRGLLEKLGNPQRQGMTIHIAGSRGKGSSALALEAILLASGLKVATFTSPHIYEYRERIRIDGQPIPGEAFRRTLHRVANAYCPEQNKPETFQTVFELLTATFFDAGRTADADIVIVETGLGGRLDCTNVIDPGAVLLTQIGLEHTHILGDTIEAIAAEKAAILKSGGWAVTTRQREPRATEVFEARAVEVGAPLIRAVERAPIQREAYTPEGIELEYVFNGAPLLLSLPLFGPFLSENLQGVLSLYGELVERNAVRRLENKEIARALENLKLPGRMEFLGDLGPERVPLFVDGAHCPTGASAVTRAMEAHFDDRAAVAVVGMMADKDHAGFFKALSAWPKWSRIYCYQLSSMPRAATAGRLADAARGHFPKVEICSNIRTALQLALDQAEDREMIVALGSIFSVGSVVEWSRCYGRA